MRQIRRAFPLTIGLATAATCVLLACDDDDTAVTPTPDAATPTNDASKSDTGSPTDSGGGTETGTDTGTPDTGADAGPTVTSIVGATGEILVSNDIVTASFYEDDVILHWSNAPSCVVFVRSPTKKPSAAGTLTVGGDIVGKDGGTAQVITVDYVDGMGYFFFPEPDTAIFPSVDTHTANVQVSAVPPSFAALPVTTFRPSPETSVTITSATAPDASTPPALPTTAPYTITWTAPSGANVGQQQISVRLEFLGSANPGSKNSVLFCSFPITAATATIPANVLADMKTRGGGGTTLDGRLHVYAGSAKEVTTVTGSYFVEVARAADSTTLPLDFDVKIQ